jgi:hypothetical protein
MRKVLKVAGCVNQYNQYYYILPIIVFVPPIRADLRKLTKKRTRRGDFVRDEAVVAREML